MITNIDSVQEISPLLWRGAGGEVRIKNYLPTYEVEFDGSSFPSGVYFYKLNAEEFSETKRMMLLK
jgi:hypothetical protein